MNIERLLAVRDNILAFPEQYNQQFIIRSHSCGAEACIAGRALLMFHPRSAAIKNWFCSPSLLPTCPFDGTSFEAAGDLLGLTDEQTERLFSEVDLWPTDTTQEEYEEYGTEDKWPYKYARAYVDAVTDSERAKVAAERIDHFIATEGRE
jgi:hypothetical protein